MSIAVIGSIEQENEKSRRKILHSIAEVLGISIEELKDPYTIKS